MAENAQNSGSDWTVSEGPNGTQIATSPDGSQVVLPGGVDFSNLEAPFVDILDALSTAQDVGRQNRDTFFQNITRSKQPALDLVQTDVEGIKLATDQLAPYIRQQGNIDTTTNIDRAGKIDAANFARIPGFNTFNRGETALANDFNRQEREKSIEASGLNYRSRITKVLDELSTQSEGKLSDPLLNTLMTSTARNRGADIASSAGISSLSGAGVNVQDKLDINQRISLALDAQKTLPGVLTQGQSVLQPPEFQLPPVLATPTQIPLNTSNVADKIPVTSNISAGAAQQSLAKQATDYEVVPVSQVFGSAVGVQQFNANSQFEVDKLNLENQANIKNAQEDAIQVALNQDREAQQQAIADNQLNNQGTASIISGIGSIIGSTPGAGSSIGESIMNGAGNIIGAASDGINSIVNAGVSAADQIFGDGNGKVQIGDMTLGKDDWNNMMHSIGQVFNGNPTVQEPTQINGSPVIEASPLNNGHVVYTAEDGSTQDVASSSGGLAGIFREVSAGIKDTGVDAQTVGQSAVTIANWDKLTPDQKLNSVNQISASILQDKGVISEQDSKNITNAGNAISVIANPKSTDAQRAAALASAGVGAATSGATATNSQSAISAFSILTNPNASTEQKISALSALGVQNGMANKIVSQVAGGNILAGLSIFNTASNWNDMNPVQRAASLMQTSGAIFHAMNQTISTSTGSAFADSGASVLGFTESTGTNAAMATAGNVLGAAGGVTSIAMGVDQAADTIDSVRSMPRSSAQGQGAAGGAIAGAEIGAGVAITAASIGAMTAAGAAAGSAVPVPIIGTIVGAAVGAAAGLIIGSTGTGKNTAQKLRDGWRSGLDEAGLATKENGTYMVTLADGSKYNLGADGNAKVKSSDGSERYTYDVDWKNSAAVNSIPDAHLFAIASGLDPTSADKFDLFNRAVGQSLNAASSNTNSSEGIKENFKQMMGGIDPRNLAMRVESLRLTNNITENEYGIYLDRINSLFGTKITPTDKNKALSSTIQLLESSKAKYDKDLLKTLTNGSELEKRRLKLEERLRRNANT